MQTYNLPSNPKVLIFDIDMTLYTCPEYAHEQIDCQIRHWAKLNGYSVDGARNMIADFRRKWAADHNGQKISLGNLFTSFAFFCSLAFFSSFFRLSDNLSKSISFSNFSRASAPISALKLPTPYFSSAS